MSRVFILSSNRNARPYPVYPLGAAIVAAALERNGHHVRQMDFLSEDERETLLAEALSAFRPEFVCISLRNIDDVDSLSGDYAWHLRWDKKLVSLIRRSCSSPIILGGPAFSLLPEEILEYLEADYGVTGEGELVICKLIHDLSQGLSPPRILKGQSRPLEGKEMCAPLWDEKAVKFYLEKSGMLNLQTKRGCPHLCAYCSYPLLEGRTYRHREPESVADEIIELKKRFLVERIFFTDSIFNDSEGRYLQVANVLLSRDVKILWSGFFRPIGTSRKELAILKRSGLYAIEVGTDGASDVTLGELKKGFTFKDVEAFSKYCSAEEIPSAHFVIFGGPGETESSVNQGLTNLKRLRDCVVFAYSGIRLLPGTSLYQRALEEEVAIRGASLLRPIYYFSPLISSEWMNEQIKRAFSGNRNMIFPPSEGLIRLEIMHRFGYKGLLWNKMISFPNTKSGGVQKELLC